MKCHLQPENLVFILRIMKTLLALVAFPVVAFLPSCAPVSPGQPEDPSTMMRLHRATPSEDLQESERTRGGGVISTSGKRDWNF
jgi:hypothetical protein